MEFTLCIVIAFAFNLWLHSYYLLLKREDKLKKHCSSIDTRALEAQTTLHFYKEFRQLRLKELMS